MKRNLIFLVFLLRFGINLIAQEKTEDNCSIRILNDQTEKSANKYLQSQSALINTLVAKDCKFLHDSLFMSVLPIDTLKNNEICENISQTVDSIIVILDNGIAWNLNNDPPEQPKRFHLKMFSKKWNDNQAVIDRIKYLKFCSQFDNSNDNPCTVNDTYNVYTRILYKGKAILNAVFEIDFKAQSKRIDLIHLENFHTN